MWRYYKSFEYFGDGLKQNYEQATTGFASQVKIRDQFEKAIQQTDKIHFLEFVMPPMDAPKSLVLTIEGINNENMKYKKKSNI